MRLISHQLAGSAPTVKTVGTRQYGGTHGKLGIKLVPKITMSNIDATPKMKGAITGLYGDVLQGWAADTNAPDRAVVVEIYVDGVGVAFVRANELSKNEKGVEEYYGFSIQIKNSWLETASLISARTANTDYWLEGSIRLPASAPEVAPFAASQVWHTGGLKISGWAWDAADPDRTVIVRVRKNNKIICHTAADRLHHALTYRSSRRHGFEMELPWELADGQIHELHVESDSGEPLSGSPLILCYRAEGLESLIRKTLPDIDVNSRLDLIINLARQHEILLPKSAGFQLYPQWFDVFQKPARLEHATFEKCAVLIVSDGCKSREAISVASARNQRVQPAFIEVTNSEDILPSIRRLIASGSQYVVPVIAGDQLAPHALDYLIPLLAAGAMWAYADSDYDGEKGERTSPCLKPVWDIDLFIGQEIFSKGSIIRATTLSNCAAILENQINSDLISWQFLLAAIAYQTETIRAQIPHLPRVLYHCQNESVKTSTGDSPCGNRSTALSWLVNSLNAGALIEHAPGYPNLLRAKWPLPKKLPKITLMIPTRDHVKLLKTCIEGVLSITDYPDIEIIVIDNDSCEPETHEYFANLQSRGVKILPHPYPFNYAAVNNRAAELATGELVCLLNNDIEIIDGQWLKELVRHAFRPNIGVVGAKLLWANGMVQHGGVVVGINGLAAHAGNAIENDDLGYLALNQLSHRRSAVTGACMLMSKSLYLKHGGMNEKLFPVAFNDVDLCLRIKEAGHDILWCASSRLIHAESASRGKDLTRDRMARANREQNAFTKRWFSNGAIDPTYHPHLSLDYLSGPYGGLRLALDSSAYNVRENGQNSTSASNL
jgi:GT2 family glycosyltransferase